MPRRWNGRQIWPRYHQLDVTRKLLKDAAQKGAGQRYLIQHSAGSGKSNSIAWVARQLITVEHQGKPAFDSIIVITDRVVLDQQIKENHPTVHPSGLHGGRSGRPQGILEGSSPRARKSSSPPSRSSRSSSTTSGANTGTVPSPSSSTRPTRDRAGKAGRAVNRALVGMTPEDDVRSGGRGRGQRGQDKQDHREPEAAHQRLLPRLHRHPEEQDPRTVRHRGPTARRDGRGTCPFTTTR